MPDDIAIPEQELHALAAKLSAVLEAELQGEIGSRPLSYSFIVTSGNNVSCILSVNEDPGQTVTSLRMIADKLTELTKPEPANAIQGRGSEAVN